MVSKKKEIKEEMIRKVEIVARKWHKPGTAEFFHSVRVNVLLKHHSKPIELIYVESEEGSDRAYDRTAMVEWSKIFPQPPKSRLFLSRHLEEKGVSVTLFKTDVNFKKDL